MNYHKQSLITKDLLKGIPESLKDDFVKQSNEVKVESILYIQGKENLYLVKSKNITRNNDNLQNKSSDQSGSAIISSGFEQISKEKKLIKNFKNNNFSKK